MYLKQNEAKQLIEYLWSALPHMDKQYSELIYKLRGHFIMHAPTDGLYILDTDTVMQSKTLMSARSRNAEDDGCTCQCCGQKYTVDLLISDELWSKIELPSKGLMCGACIMERIENICSYDAYKLGKT